MTDEDCSTKICTQCHQRKNLDAFAINRIGKLGRQAACKACLNAQAKAKKAETGIKRAAKENITHLVCKKCGANKPIDSGYFKHATGKYGVRSVCKSCYPKPKKPDTNKYEEAKKLGITHRVCTKCGKNKKLEEFRRWSYGKYGVQPECLVCAKERSRARYRSLSEEEKIETLKTKQAKAKALGIREQTCSDCGETKPLDEYYDDFSFSNGKSRLCRSCHSMAAKKWREENPESMSAISRRRRARKKGAAGDHTQSDVLRLLQNQKHCCAYCKKKVKKTYEVDHIVPLAKGGSNAPDNLQILCVSCNRRKSAKDPIVWANQIGLLL